MFKDAPGTTALVFNADVAVATAASDSLVTIAGAVGELSGFVFVGAPVVCTVAGNIGELVGAVALRYSSNTARPTVGHVSSHWQAAVSHDAYISDTAHNATRTPVRVDGVYQAAARLNVSHTARWQSSTHRNIVFTPAFQQALRFQQGLTGRFAPAIRRDSQTVVSFERAERLRSTLDGRFQQTLRRHAEIVALLQAGLRMPLGVTDHAQKGVPVGLRYATVYQAAIRPPAGRWVVIVPPTVEPCYTPDPNLVFSEPYGGLVFVCERHTEEPPVPVGASLFILPARFYMTTHNVFAQRLPDLAPVPLYDATVSADAGSYCWTLQLSGPASLFELLAPVAGLPAQIRVTMDGIPWVFAVDGMQRTSAFGKTGVSVTGRSVTALIGAPYLRALTRDNASTARLAQQLALSALEFSGVDLDWGLTDWLVPAGAWSHSGTPLEAVQAIAQAAGGYLQSHRSDPTLLTRHPYSQRTGDYPGAPWEWMTGPADVELAPDVIITDGVDRQDGADINAVYVSGTAQGVLARVKRTSTAGDKLSAMVTDALITHADAARQRGLAILGAAGSKYNVRLELPVLTGASQPGVLEVGQLVQVNAASPWRGRVRAVSASYKRPTLRQTVTLERHLETA